MKKGKLHYNTINPFLHEVLKTLMAAPEFNAFRLVGGTALSLQRGHRKSVDIDLFTDALYRSVDFDAIDSFLRSHYSYVSTNSVVPVVMGRPYYIGKSKEDSIKLDLFYTDEFIQPALLIDDIRMATAEEIIAMKLEVISQAGRKKDFWDLHEMKDEYSLQAMLKLHEKRYPWTHEETLIKRNFTDFSKADKDEDPVCLKNKNWNLIKLDMMSFAKPVNNAVLKIEHTFIELKNGVPKGFNVKGGIDYFNTLLHLRFSPGLANKKITLGLTNITGEKYQTPLHFNSSGIKSFFLAGSEMDIHIIDPLFPYIEFESDEDISFEFWAEDQQGGFMDI